MREIKFRAWIPDVKQLRDVIAIEFDEPDDVYTHVPIVRVWDHPSTRAAKIKGRVATFLKKDVTLMQYTGLKDKNGKEIYEGDIVTDGKGKAVVYYRPPGFICVIENQDSFWLGAGLSYPENHQLKETEVIGNIYENPELLTPSKEKNG